MKKDKQPATMDLRIVLEPDLAEQVRQMAAASCRNYQQEVQFQLRRAYMLPHPVPRP